jgi:hypothetical protein
MGALQSLPHQLGVADAFKAVVRAAFGKLNNRVDDTWRRRSVDEVRHAEPARHTLAGRIDVDTDDLIGAHHPRTLDDVEADTAETENPDVRACFNLRSEEHRADAGRDAAADVANGLEGRVLAHLGDCDLGHDDVLGESRRTHVVEDGLSANREAAGAVGHQSLALGCADLLAEVGLLRQAELALVAADMASRVLPRQRN